MVRLRSLTLGSGLTLEGGPVQIGIPRVTPPVQLDTGVVAPCGSASGWPLCSSAPPRWPRGRLSTGWRRVVPLVTGWPRAAPSVALPAGTLRGHSRGALPGGHFQGALARGRHARGHQGPYEAARGDCARGGPRRARPLLGGRAGGGGTPCWEWGGLGTETGPGQRTRPGQGAGRAAEVACTLTAARAYSTHYSFRVS